MNNREIGIVITGSVDSGKSSTIGVLISNKLDDGNGLARQTVAKHQHEKKTGQTSDISLKQITDKETNKNIVLIDLCGHEKYLKTTTYGISGYFPDYAVVTIAANRGILKMTKEHLGILFYMKIPTIILYTRIDIAPKDVLESNIKSINKICSHFKKKLIKINDEKEFYLSQENNNNNNNNENKNLEKFKEVANQMKEADDFIPIIMTSNKTGFYIDTLKKCLFTLEPRNIWQNNSNLSVFYTESCFNPPGIGFVVSGLVKGKSFKTNQTVFLGPWDNKFISVRIRSIHNNIKELVSELSDHNRGCFALSSNDKKIDLLRKNFKHGMVIIDDIKLAENLTDTFKAEIEVLHHQASIKVNYCPVLHIGNIRYSASIIKIENNNENKENKDEEQILKTKDKAIVEFKFIDNTKQYIEKGMTFFFREGSTRGIGRII